MTKLTYRNALAYVLENCDLPTEYKDKLTELSASLSSKARKNPNAEKNAILYNLLSGVLSAEGHTVTELLGMIENAPEGTSSQACTSVLGAMMTEGKVVNYKDKGKSLYKLAD